MKRRLIKVMTLVAMLTVTASAFTACSTKKEEKTDTSTTTTAKAQPGEIKFFIRATSDQAKNYQPVFDEFEKRTKDTLNTHINVTVIPAADYKTQMQLKITAQEDMDLVFDAGFLNLNTFATQGVYQDLSKYFNNDAYPGLKKSFSKDYLDANKVFDKLIAVPITNTFIDMNGFYYRKDLVKKYGLKDINTYDDLEAYWKAIQANEKGMTPLGAKGALGRNFQDETRARDGHIYTVTGVPGGVEVGISGDGKKVLAVTSQADPTSAFASYPSPWNKPDTKNFDMVKKYANYINQDAMVTKEIDPLFTAGKVGTIEGTINSYANFSSQLSKNVPGSELGFWLSNDDQRNLKEKAILTTYQAWNFLCVPTNSKNADRSMKFLDWVFSSQENNDLFQYGIEGKNWEKVGDKSWKLPTGVDPSTNYAFPGFELTWNPNYTRLPDGVPTDIQKMFQYEYNASSFTKSFLAGFTFDNTNVKSEIAKLTEVDSKYNPTLQVGLESSISDTLAKKLADQKAAGLDKVKAEIQTQVQKFLDSKK
jgi:putative aldouronate transport system substrate-binding protein